MEKPTFQSSFQRRKKVENNTTTSLDPSTSQKSPESPEKGKQSSETPISASNSVNGTKTSPFSGHSVISSGLFELDEMLGCLALGSMMLIEQDELSNYADYLAKYFVVEGLAVDHEILFVSGELDQPHSFLTTLPKNLTLEEEQEEEKEKIRNLDEGRKMEIAWQ